MGDVSDISFTILESWRIYPSRCRPSIGRAALPYFRCTFTTRSLPCGTIAIDMFITTTAPWNIVILPSGIIGLGGLAR